MAGIPKAELFGYSIAALLVAVLVVVINDWQKRRLAKRSESKGKMASWRFRNNRTEWSFVLFLCVVAPLLLALMFWSPNLFIAVASYALWFFIGIVVLFFIFQVVRIIVLLGSHYWKQRHLRQVRRLVSAGRADEARRNIDEKLQRHGLLPELLHASIGLHFLNEEWNEALAVINSAEQHGVDPKHFLQIKGFLYEKTGQQELAEYWNRQAFQGDTEALK